jgi:hypothetical protein
MNMEILIAGLIFRCPIEKNDLNCPFIEIRGKSINERLKFIKQLNCKELRFLENYHKVCLCGNHG